MHLDGSDLRFTSTPALTRGPSSRPCWDPPMLLESAFPFSDILAKRPLTSSFSSSHPSPFPHTSHLTSYLAPYTCPVFNFSLTNQTKAVTAFFSDKTCNSYLLEFLLAPFHLSSPLLLPPPRSHDPSRSPPSLTFTATSESFLTSYLPLSPLSCCSYLYPATCLYPRYKGPSSLGGSTELKHVLLCIIHSVFFLPGASGLTD